MLRINACAAKAACYFTVMRSLPVLLLSLMAAGSMAFADESGLLAEGATVDRDGNVFFTDQPNDLWIRPDGHLYFTDPLYARDYWQRDKASRQPGQYVYLYGVKMRVKGAC